jgi:hypothetical protein
MKQALIPAQIIDLANLHGYDPAALDAVIDVESSGHGFSPVTGKIIIQFEPAWFKREYADWRRYAAGSVWVNNGIGPQNVEWRAFDNAFSIDPDAAMKSTSIGLMQIMGFHYDVLGFKTVGEMWDFAKVSVANQLEQGIRFVKSIPALDKALQHKDWQTFAYYYNGSGYRKYNYDERLKKAYEDSKIHLQA